MKPAARLAAEWRRSDIGGLAAVRIAGCARDPRCDRRVDDGAAAQPPPLEARPRRSQRGTLSRTPRGRTGCADATRASLGQASMERTWNRQREWRDRRFERKAVFGHHPVRAAHRADGRRNAGAARILETLAGLEHRLLADHALAFHLLHAVL